MEKQSLRNVEGDLPGRIRAVQSDPNHVEKTVAKLKSLGARDYANVATIIDRLAALPDAE